MGGLIIENDVSIGHGSTILTTEHDYMQTELPMRNAPLIKKPTHIKRDVWIGCHVTVLAGVTIGEGAVIGAGAVVTKSIPDYAIAVGVPAQVKCYRQFSKKGESILPTELNEISIATYCD
jgi:acetyltransferase-like isoleucine patch superfamily enzyme